MKHLMQYLHQLCREAVAILSLITLLVSLLIFFDIPSGLLEDLKVSGRGIEVLSFAYLLFMIANYRIWARDYERLKQLRRKVASPKITMSIEHEAFPECILSFRNIGKDNARNIHIRFNPNIKAYKLDYNLNASPHLKCEYLSPSIGSNYIYVKLGDWQDEHPAFARKFTVTIDYANSDLTENYRDELEIDFSTLGDMPMPPHSLKTIIVKLDDINKTLEKSLSKKQKG